MQEGKSQLRCRDVEKTHFFVKLLAFLHRLALASSLWQLATAGCQLNDRLHEFPVICVSTHMMPQTPPLRALLDGESLQQNIERATRSHWTVQPTRISLPSVVEFELVFNSGVNQRRDDGSVRLLFPSALGCPLLFDGREDIQNIPAQAQNCPTSQSSTYIGAVVLQIHGSALRPHCTSQQNLQPDSYTSANPAIV